VLVLTKICDIMYFQLKHRIYVLVPWFLKLVCSIENVLILLVCGNKYTVFKDLAHSLFMPSLI
jgi:hypothetical protein